MILRGARVAVSASLSRTADIEISRRSGIRSVGRIPGREGVDFSGYIILPGLVNAHDHLEFNLFPRLGNGPYESAAAWATDIHARYAEPIREVLDVPLVQRLVWGGIRNLVAGVTTVCHHNPWDPAFGRRFPVRVVRSVSWAHSHHFSRDLLKRYRSCPRRRPFVFHAGEANNSAGRSEMAELARLGLLASNSVLVHAVALAGASLELARRNGCAIVWCPSSNLFLLGGTLTREVLDSGLPIALGTDSGLSAEGDMLDELRVARETSGLGEERLYAMVTTGPARVLRLTRGEGCIRPGGLADLLIYRDTGLTPAQTLFRELPEAVFLRGRVQLASERFATEWTGVLPRIACFHGLAVEGRGSIRVNCAVPAMPKGLRLAGRQVATCSRS